MPTQCVDPKLYSKAVFASLLSDFPQSPKGSPKPVPSSSLASLDTPHEVVVECCNGDTSLFPGIDRGETLVQYEQRKRYWRKIRRSLLSIPEDDLHVLIDKVLQDGVLEKSISLPETQAMAANNPTTVGAAAAATPSSRLSSIAKSVTDKWSAATNTLGTQAALDVRATQYSLSSDLDDGKCLVVGDVVSTSVTLVNRGNTKAKFKVTQLHWISQSKERSPVLAKIYPDHGVVPKRDQATFHVSVNVSLDTIAVDEILIVEVDGGPRIPLLVSLQCCKPLFGSPVYSLPATRLSVGQQYPGFKTHVTVPLVVLRMVGWLLEMEDISAPTFQSHGNFLDDNLQGLKRTLETSRTTEENSVAVTASNIVALLRLWLRMLPTSLLDQVDLSLFDTDVDTFWKVFPETELGTLSIIGLLLREALKCSQDEEQMNSIIKSFSSLLRSDSSGT